MTTQKSGLASKSKPLLRVITETGSSKPEKDWGVTNTDNLISNCKAGQTVLGKQRANFLQSTPMCPKADRSSSLGCQSKLSAQVIRNNYYAPPQKLPLKILNCNAKLDHLPKFCVFQKDLKVLGSVIDELGAASSIAEKSNNRQQRLETELMSSKMMMLFCKRRSSEQSHGHMRPASRSTENTMEMQVSKMGTQRSIMRNRDRNQIEGTQGKHEGNRNRKSMSSHQKLGSTFKQIPNDQPLNPISFKVISKVRQAQIHLQHHSLNTVIINQYLQGFVASWRHQKKRHQLFPNYTIFQSIVNSAENQAKLSSNRCRLQDLLSSCNLQSACPGRMWYIGTHIYRVKHCLWLSNVQLRVQLENMGNHRVFCIELDIANSLEQVLQKVKQQQLGTKQRNRNLISHLYDGRLKLMKIESISASLQSGEPVIKIPPVAPCEFRESQKRTITRATQYYAHCFMPSPYCGSIKQRSLSIVSQILETAKVGQDRASHEHQKSQFGWQQCLNLLREDPQMHTKITHLIQTKSETVDMCTISRIVIKHFQFKNEHTLAHHHTRWAQMAVKSVSSYLSCCNQDKFKHHEFVSVLHNQQDPGSGDQTDNDYKLLPNYSPKSKPISNEPTQNRQTTQNRRVANSPHHKVKFFDQPRNSDHQNQCSQNGKKKDLNIRSLKLDRQSVPQNNRHGASLTSKRNLRIMRNLSADSLKKQTVRTSSKVVRKPWRYVIKINNRYQLVKVSYLSHAYLLQRIRFQQQISGKNNLQDLFYYHNQMVYMFIEIANPRHKITAYSRIMVTMSKWEDPLSTLTKLQEMLGITNHQTNFIDFRGICSTHQSSGCLNQLASGLRMQSIYNQQFDTPTGKCHNHGGLDQLDPADQQSHYLPKISCGVLRPGNKRHNHSLIVKQSTTYQYFHLQVCLYSYLNLTVFIAERLSKHKNGCYQYISVGSYLDVANQLNLAPRCDAAQRSPHKNRTCSNSKGQSKNRLGRMIRIVQKQCNQYQLNLLCRSGPIQLRMLGIQRYKYELINRSRFQLNIDLRDFSIENIRTSHDPPSISMKLDQSLMNNQQQLLRINRLNKHERCYRFVYFFHEEEKRKKLKEYRLCPTQGPPNHKNYVYLMRITQQREEQCPNNQPLVNEKLGNYVQVQMVGTLGPGSTKLSPHLGPNCPQHQIKCLQEGLTRASRMRRRVDKQYIWGYMKKGAVEMPSD